MLALPHAYRPTSGLYTCVRLTTAHPRICRGREWCSCGRGDGVETPKALGESGGLLALVFAQSSMRIMCVWD